jgi:hypothetical protein
VRSTGEGIIEERSKKIGAKKKEREKKSKR